MSQANEQLDELLAKINDVVSGAKELNDVGVETTAQVTQQIRTLEILRDRFSEDAYAVKQLTEAIDGLNEKIGVKIEPSGTFFSGMRDGFKKLQDNMLTARDVGERVVGDLASGFSNLFDSMIRGGQSWSEMMRGFFADVLGSFVRMMAEMQAQQMMRGLFGETFGQTGGSLGGVFGTVKGWFSGPELATGTNYVPADGMAYLHQGEAIVPREFNPAAFAPAYAGGGESRPIEIVIQNLIDPQSVPRAMAGRDGQAVVSNHIAMDAKRNGQTRHTIRNN